MKTKNYFGMLATVSMLLAASCTSDENLSDPIASGDMVNASFTVEAPAGIKTRAVGDGTTVDKVVCAVYDADGNELPALRKTVDIVGKKAVYNVRLAKGQEYRAVFFAYNEAADAYEVADLKNIVVKEEQKSNLEARDAFTAYTDITESETKGNLSKSVTLYRPFAQLNLGSTNEDVEVAAQSGIVVTKSSVKVSNVYKNFNAYEDAVVNGAATYTVEYALNAIPTEKLKAAGVEYTYLALNYLLVGDKSLTDVKFTWVADSSGRTNTSDYTNVPVQRNYRTNIVGSLLTSPAEFNILVDADFREENNIYDAWDGTTVTAVAETDGVYEVKNGAELAWIAKQVNTGANTFAGKTVRLAADIYLANAQWKAIGNVQSYPSQTFAGVFDGNGKTVFGLNVTSAEAAGLFGSVSGQVKSLTVDGATVSSSHYAGVVCGYASVDVGMRIENCHVKNATLVCTTEQIGANEYDNGDKAGAIIGYMAAGGVVTGCTVENTKVTAYRDLGGIAGYSAGTVENCLVLNAVVVTVDATHNYKNYPTLTETFDANSIVGHNAGTVSNCSGDATLVVPQNVTPVGNAADLKAMLNAFGAADAGNNVVNITADILIDEPWTPVVIDGYNGADVVIINGNGHTIKGLTAPLFAGGFAGGSGVVVNNLTIDASTIVSTNTLGSGAFVETSDSQDRIELNNCHLKNSSVTGSRTGGLIGWTSGYNNVNDGAVDLYVTIKNCTVENCRITGDGTVGGIYGHAGANPATFSTIENCKVINCQLVSNDDSYRVGGIVGTANVGQVVINNCTVDAATTMVQNNNGTEIPRPTGQSNLYGRVAFAGVGSLTIDGMPVL